jgi:hypothetical protein
MTDIDDFRTNYFDTDEHVRNMHFRPQSERCKNTMKNLRIQPGFIYNLLYPLLSYNVWNITKEKKDKIRESLNLLFLQPPNMSKAEQDIIYKYCNSNSKVLEYGAGFSTLHLSKRCKHLTTVEHNPDWFPRIYMISAILGAENISFVSALDKEYYLDVKKFGDKKFDLVSIDGDYRLDCAKAILPNLHDESVVVFSDFWRPDRQEKRGYSKVFEWYDEIESCKEGNTYVVLKRKAGYPWD